MPEGENATEQPKAVEQRVRVVPLEPISPAKSPRSLNKQKQIIGEPKVGSLQDFGLRKRAKTKHPTFLGRALKPYLYEAKEVLDFATGRRLPLPILPESWRYAMTSASYKDYDRTFGFSSVDEMRRWYGLHPGDRGAILELAGFGLAPNGLVKALKKKGIGGNKISYGLALARELSPDFSTPYSELVDGNLGEIALKDQGDLVNMLKKKLRDNGCNGAALIYLRPLGAYPDISLENKLPNTYSMDAYETGVDFYIKMFTRISRELLSHDGKFALELPYPTLEESGNKYYAKGLRIELGKDFTVSNARNVDIFLPLTSLLYRTSILTITRK